MRADYIYDTGNQLTRITNLTLPSTLISQYEYTYDQIGNRLTMTAPDGVHTYGYNDIYELTSVTGARNHSFAYDNVGNRSTVDGVAYSANNLNQYLQAGTVSFGYDANRQSQ